VLNVHKLSFIQMGLAMFKLLVGLALESLTNLPIMQGTFVINNDSLQLFSGTSSTFFRNVYELFGDRVKYWITLNEPAVFSDAGYDHCEMAPGECGGPYLGRFARHYSLLAHGKAYEIYDNG